MTTDTRIRELCVSLDFMLTEMGFQLASGSNDTHFQVWTRVSTDMTVKRQGDSVYVETTARQGYPVATVDQIDLETVLTRALLHAHDDEPEEPVAIQEPARGHCAVFSQNAGTPCPTRASHVFLRSCAAGHEHVSVVCLEHSEIMFESDGDDQPFSCGHCALEGNPDVQVWIDFDFDIFNDHLPARMSVGRGTSGYWYYSCQHGTEPRTYDERFGDEPGAFIAALVHSGEAHRDEDAAFFRATSAPVAS